MYNIYFDIENNVKNYLSKWKLFKGWTKHTLRAKRFLEVQLKNVRRLRRDALWSTSGKLSVTEFHKSLIIISSSKNNIEDYHGYHGTWIFDVTTDPWVTCL